MAVVVTRHFASTFNRPKAPPDGKSLEELMNAFLASLPLSAVMDVQTGAVLTDGSHVTYWGVVVYQG